MLIFKIKRFNEITNDMKNWVIAQSVGLTNFNPGSVIRTILESVAIKIEELYFKVYFALLSAIPTSVYEGFDFSRREGAFATGNVVFSRATPATLDIEIPIGTIVATGDGKQFETTVLGTISLGNTSSGQVSSRALLQGLDGNVNASTITTLVTLQAGVETVNNPAAFANGIDAETDNQRKRRFQNYILGLGRTTIYGLLRGALEVEGVVSATVKENDPNVGQVKLYIDDGTGAASSALITSVTNHIEGTNTTDDQGFRPVGIQVVVAAPTKIKIDVTASLTIDPLYDSADVITAVTTAINNFLSVLEVGADVIFYELVSDIVDVDGVLDAVVTTNIDGSPPGTSNITINDGEVARPDTIIVS